MQSTPETSPAAAQLPLNKLVPNVSETNYNADAGLRSTELKHAAKSSAHWRAYLTTPRADSDELAFGRLAHLAILEPDRFRKIAHLQPECGDLRTKMGKDALAQWRASLPSDAVTYTAKDKEVLLGIYKSVTGHSRAKVMLHKAQREVALAWTDEQYALRCKARFDIITEHGFVVDLKTCRDASYEVFSKELVNRNYTLSAAHYLEGVRQGGVSKANKFFFIACEKTPPYAVAIYSLSPEALKRGRWWQRHALANIKEARDTGVFAGYPEVVQTIEEPGYAPLPPGYTRQQLYED